MLTKTRVICVLVCCTLLRGLCVGGVVSTAHQTTSQGYNNDVYLFNTEIYYFWPKTVRLSPSTLLPIQGKLDITILLSLVCYFPCHRNAIIFIMIYVRHQCLFYNKHPNLKCIYVISTLVCLLTTLIQLQTNHWLPICKSLLPPRDPMLNLVMCVVSRLPLTPTMLVFPKRSLYYWLVIDSVATIRLPICKYECFSSLKLPSCNLTYHLGLISSLNGQLVCLVLFSVILYCDLYIRYMQPTLEHCIIMLDHSVVCKYTVPTYYLYEMCDDAVCSSSTATTCFHFHLIKPFYNSELAIISHYERVHKSSDDTVCSLSTATTCLHIIKPYCNSELAISSHYDQGVPHRHQIATVS